MRLKVNLKEWSALIAGLLLFLLGLGITSVICVSGVWGLAQEWPILVVSVPMSLGGFALLRLAIRAKRAR
jgi:hypothetical protein